MRKGYKIFYLGCLIGGAVGIGIGGGLLEGWVLPAVMGATAAGFLVVEDYLDARKVRKWCNELGEEEM